MSSRRRFINNTAKIAAGAAFAPLIVQGKRFSPNEKINIALIGCRNMGFGNLENALKVAGVECAALWM